jgi:hypothetical protein
MRITLYIALFMTFATTFLLYAALQQEGIRRAEHAKYGKIEENINICKERASVCEQKMIYLDLLIQKERI